MIASRSPLPLTVPAAAALLAAVLAWLFSVGNVADYFSYQMPPGQTLYVFSKLAGLLAATLLTLQIVLVLLRDASFFRRRFVWNTRLHAAFGLLTVTVLAAHVTLFVAAVSLRSGILELNLLLPLFGHGIYRTGVSLGAIGLLTLAVAVPMGVVMRRWGRGSRLLNVHRLGVVALGLGIVHALVIGSEKSSIIALAICAASVLTVIIWRWSRSRTG